MEIVTVKDVLFEMTFRWDKNTAIQSIMYPDDNMIGPKCEAVIKMYDELYSIYGLDIEMIVDMVETITQDGLDENDRLKIITELVELKGFNHNLNTEIKWN